MNRYLKYLTHNYKDKIILNLFTGFLCEIASTEFMKHNYDKYYVISRFHAFK